MSFFVQLDIAPRPKKFNSFDEALNFVEKKLRDPEMVLKWRREDPQRLKDQIFQKYTRQELAEEIAKCGEVVLQLTLENDDVYGDLATIMTEELEKKEREESTAEITKLGQQLAQSTAPSVLKTAGVNRLFMPERRDQ